MVRVDDLIYYDEQYHHCLVIKPDHGCVVMLQDQEDTRSIGVFYSYDELRSSPVRPRSGCLLLVERRRHVL